MWGPGETKEAHGAEGNVEGSVYEFGEADIMEMLQEGRGAARAIGGSPEGPEGYPVRFGSLNCSGLSGKVHLIERAAWNFGLDFVFLSETWCRPGQTARLDKGILFAQEYSLNEEQGRTHYGQAVWVNETRAPKTAYELIQSDGEAHTLVLRFAGIRFVCVYIPPNRSGIEGFLQGLGPTLLTEEPTIMMGDLNARHLQFGDHAQNGYGTELVRQMGPMGLTRLRPTAGKWTFRRRDTRDHRSIPDHILANERAVERGAGYLVDESMCMGTTEHSLLVGKVRGDRHEEPRRGPKTRAWNRWRLNEPAVMEKYRGTLGSTLESLMTAMAPAGGRMEARTEQEEANRLDGLVLKWIEGALSRHMGRASGNGWRKGDFVTPEIARRETKLQECRECILRPGRDPGLQAELEKRYVESWDRLQEAIKGRRDEFFREFAERLQRMTPSEQMRTMHAVKRSKSRASSMGLQDDPGSLERYARYFAGQYQNRNPGGDVERGEEMWTELGETEPVGAKGGDEEPSSLADLAAPQRPSPTTGEAAGCSSPISEGSIMAALQCLPKGKATGNSGLPAEALLAAGMLAVGPLKVLFQFCWEKGVVPTSWKVARIQPIHKKGITTEIRNYRPISLTEVTRRLFERLILGSVTTALEPLSVEQGGFRAGRGTVDQVMTLHEWNCQAQASGLPRYMVFLDIKAAYDQVDRGLLWSKCRKKGMGAKLITMLRALFDDNRSCIGINGQLSEEFPLQSGLLQGSPLSPVLYSAFIDDLVGDLNALAGAERLTLGGRKFRCLLYADDIVLMSTSWADLKRLLEICEAHSIRNRYRFGVAKCEAVLSAEVEQLTLYGERLKHSESFTYLGVPFGAKGLMFEAHMEALGVKAQRAASFFRSVGCNGQGFDTATCLRIFRCFVRPIMEYGVALFAGKWARVLERIGGRCLRLMTSMGRNSSPLAIGMLSEIHPATVRLTSLQFKHAVRTRGKTAEYAVNHALRAYSQRSTANSCFTAWGANQFLRTRDREVFSGQLEGRARPGPRTEDMQDRMLATLVEARRSALIFRGRNREERKALVRSFSRATRGDQRLIVNWITGRSAHARKVCRHCGQMGATRSHLERCVWGTQDPRCSDGTWIEQQLRMDPERLEQCAEAIRSLVGDRPTDGREHRPP